VSQLVITVASNPTAKEYLERSVVTGVPVEQVLGAADVVSVRSALELHGADGRIRMWGSVAGTSPLATAAWKISSECWQPSA
jgi:hypothetical protein